METKNLTIETLSPVFIGNGEVYSKFDYTSKLINDNVIVTIYNVDKIINDLPKYLNENEVFQILDEIKKELEENPNFEIVTYLKEKNKNISFKNYKIKKYTTKIRQLLTKKDILQFIHQNFTPYIPGSSIKGAINTALLYNKLKDFDKNDFENLINSGSLYPNKKYKNDIINVSNDRERYYIFDSFFNGSFLDIFMAQRFYVYHMNKNKIGTFNKNATNYIEAIKPYQKIELEIKCTSEKFDEIKEACNELSLKICKWELEILNKYKNSKGHDVFKDLIDFYKKEIKFNNNAFFLNIGWRGGYLPKTIYILAKEKGIDIKNIRKFFPYSKKKQYYRNKINEYEEFPFTRTITKYYDPKERRLKYCPLGWIKIEG
ncbi:type III-A CRISPR-associated RAMP protein Csm5 [Methanocaldococcus sp. 10A]